VSLFSVVERVRVTPVPVPQPGEAPPIVLYQPFRVTAVWMRNPEDDTAQEYEFEVRLLPAAGSAQNVTRGRFQFDPARPFHRVALDLLGPSPFTGPGVNRLECRLREVGAENWLTQDYPILVEMAAPPPAPTGTA
jgi:hypothetical protein